MKKASIKRIFAIVICVVFCVAIAFAASFIVKESSHICTGSDCKICVSIRNCESTLNSVGLSNGDISVSFGSILFLIALVAAICGKDSSTTLVSLKIKLSN